MLNKNPLWRYLVVLGLLLLALIYALPNLYPEQPALNISASRGGELTPSLVKQLANEFDRAGLKPQRDRHDHSDRRSYFGQQNGL